MPLKPSKFRKGERKAIQHSYDKWKAISDLLKAARDKMESEPCEVCDYYSACNSCLLGEGYDNPCGDYWVVTDNLRIVQDAVYALFTKLEAPLIEDGIQRGKMKRGMADAYDSTF
jgi:hypothetical protein